MAQKKPSRDSNGKFAKRPENPDCEPATKGYVKCIARTVVSKHKHMQRISHFGTEIGFFCFAAIWFVTGFFSRTLVLLPSQYLEQISWLSGFAALILVFVNLDLCDSGDETTRNGESDIKAIQKYEPPKCESPKRDCED